MSGTPVADTHYVFTISDRTEIDGRSSVTKPTQVPPPPRSVAGPTIDLSTAPAVDLKMTREQWETTLRYSPLITITSVDSDPLLVFLHTGTFGLTWSARRIRLGLNEDALYGSFNYATAPPTTQTAGAQPPPLQAVPIGETLKVGSSRTQFTTAETITRRVRLSTALGYLVTGGVDELSRQVLPLQYGPFASARADYAFTREDAARTEAAVARAQFTEARCVAANGVVAPADSPHVCAPTADLVTVTEGWVHRWKRTLEFSIYAGFGSYRTRTGTSDPTTPDPFVYKTVPVAGLQLADHIRANRARIELSANVRLAPVIVQLAGTVQQRIDADIGLAWTRRRFTVGGLVRVSQTIASVPGDTTAGLLVHGEVGAGYLFDRQNEVSWGVREDVQRFDVGGSFVSTIGFLRVTVGPAPFHL